MAEGGRGNNDTVNDEEWEKMKSARRVQELFHGRFTYQQTCAILRQNEWDENRAVVFILDGRPGEIRDAIGDEEWQVVENVRRNNARADGARRNRIETEIRQFGCQPCDHMWWAKVPSRKQVSRCNTCRPKRRYDAVPRDMEWGWAKFQCPCGNEFHGFGAMGKSLSLCYHCRGHLCDPIEIYPPLKNRRQNRNRRYTHSCTAPNCYNRTVPENQHELLVNICVHPKSLTKKVLEPSRGHMSTGSTVKTFLSQDDLAEPYDFYEPSVADIAEVRGDDGDNM